MPVWLLPCVDGQLGRLGHTAHGDWPEAVASPVSKPAGTNGRALCRAHFSTSGLPMATPGLVVVNSTGPDELRRPTPLA